MCVTNGEHYIGAAGDFWDLIAEGFQLRAGSAGRVWVGLMCLTLQSLLPAFTKIHESSVKAKQIFAEDTISSSVVKELFGLV